MKQKTSLSPFSKYASIIVIILMIAGLFIFRPLWLLLIWIVIVAIVFLSALYYAPMSIAADENLLCINRPLGAKRIPMSEIASVQTYPFSLEKFRICGSGGWMGYWGWFHAPKVGNYFAYYGNGHDCFLITLRSGRKYMLGCDNSQQMVSYICKHI